jgi:hypothetical protein
MKLNKNNIIFLCGIVLSIYLIYKYKNTSSVIEERFNTSIPKSFQNFRKTETGHICENELDGIYDSKPGSKYTEETGGWIGKKLKNTNTYKKENAKDLCYIREDCAGIQSIKNSDNWNLMPYGLNSPNNLNSTHNKLVKNKPQNRNLSTFCKQYASRKTISDIGTIIIPSATKITMNNLKTIKSSELPITKVWSGKFIKRKGVVMPWTKTNRDKNLLRNQSLTELEALNLCSKTNGCEHISIAKVTSSSRGLCHMEPPQNFRNAVLNNEYNLYSKTFNYEYSIVFWIKIDNSSNNMRNILHLGKDKNSHSPSLWIYRGGTKLTSWHSSTESVNGEFIGYTQELGYRKWNHIVYTVKDNQLKIFLNGKKITHYHFRGNPIMPIDEPLRVPSKGADGNYHLSKMMWLPMALTDDLVRNMAYGSYPLNEFDPEHSLIRSDIVTINFRNGWDEDREGEQWSRVVLKKVGNLIFLDGNIKGPKANVAVGKLPNSFRPDRNCYFISNTTGGYVTIVISRDGFIYMYDRKFKNGEYSPIKYSKFNTISLSNVRFLKDIPKNRLSSGGIAYDRIGSYIVLAGKKTIYSDNNGELMRRTNIEKSIRIPHQTFMSALTNGKKIAQVRVMTDGIRVDTIHKHGTNISLEGISWSTFNGTKLTLKNGYFPKRSPWSPNITITVSNNIVQFHGVVIKHYRRPEFKNLKDSIGCYTNDMIDYHGKDLDSIGCAKKGIKKGHLYIGLSNKGECRSGNSYGSLGESIDCYMKCNANPGEMCGGKSESTVYNISQKKELITIIPSQYRPKKNLSFSCSSGNGLTRIDVMSDGKVFWINKSLTGNNWFSLDNIMYIAEPQFNLLGDVTKGSGNSFCQFDFKQGNMSHKYCSKFNHNMTSCDHFKNNSKINNVKECHMGIGACCLDRKLIST